MIQLKNQKLYISIPSKSHLFHHIVHLVCINYTQASVLLRHTFGNTLHRIIRRGAALLLKVRRVVIPQPHEVFSTCVYLTISTSVFEGQSNPNLTRIDIVFETRTHPHRHRVFRMCGLVPSPLSILRVGCVFLNVLLLIWKEPCSIQHLTNLQLNLDNMLVAWHVGNFSRNQRKKENVHFCSRRCCRHELRRLRRKQSR